MATNTNKVTKQAGNRAALGHSEQCFHALIENSREVILLSDDQGNYSYASPSIERVLGYTRQEIITINGFELIHPDDIPSLAQAFQQLLATPGLVDAKQFRSRHKDGSWRWVEATATNLLHDPDVQAIVTNLHDISEQKQAEEELKALAEEREESLGLLDSLLEHAPVGFAFFDRTHRYVKINNFLADINGIPAQEHLGRTIEERLPVIAETFVPILEKVFETETPSLDIEVTGETPRQPGVRRHWLTNFYPVFDNKRKVCYVGATVVEITERKQAEERLKESEQRFRLLADSAPVMVWMAGVDKLCIYFNSPWLEFTGRTMAQELGNGWAEGVHPDDLQRCLDIYTSSFDARKPFSMDYRLRRLDGQYRWVLDNGIPLYTSDGTFSGYIGSCIDITERRRLEQQLQYSEQKLRSLVESNIFGVTVSDTAGRIYETNEQFVQMLGYSKDELLSRTFDWGRLIPPDYQEAKAQAVQTLLSTGALSPREKEYLRKDGSRVPVLVGATMIDQQTQRALLVILDISEQKAAERRKQEFLSMVSHELRTPLQSIMGYIELALRFIELLPRPLSPEVNELIGKIEAGLTLALGQADIETRLVEEVLGVSRLEMGKFELTLQQCNLVTVVREVVAGQQQAAPLRHLELVLPPQEEVPVMADAMRIGQALTNYLTNALRYSPAERDVLVRLEVDGTVARVSVRDHGPGLTPEQQQQIWERFYQAGAPGYRGEDGGLGLGLYIARSIIEQHQGQAGVESCPGEGSTFWFTLLLAGKNSTIEPEP